MRVREAAPTMRAAIAWTHSHYTLHFLLKVYVQFYYCHFPNPWNSSQDLLMELLFLPWKRKQLKPCYNFLMLTSEWRDYRLLQKAACLFNVVFTCLKVNCKKSLPSPHFPLAQSTQACFLLHSSLVMGPTSDISRDWFIQAVLVQSYPGGIGLKNWGGWFFPRDS